MFYEQSGFDARFEWGVEGLRRLGPSSNVLVIVDVLSFCTAVDIVVDRGGSVLPYGWRDETARSFAQDAGALLAGIHRHPTDDEPYTLSPSSLESISHGTLLVLPSPNGATLSHIAADMHAVVFAGCVRNAETVAHAVRSVGDDITVIAAGEQWSGGMLRPAVEDLVGAGAVLAAFQPRAPSPEAHAAIAAFQSAEPDLFHFLLDSASGRELQERGFEHDVRLAAQLNVSSTAPILQDNTFSARMI